MGLCMFTRWRQRIFNTVCSILIHIERLKVPEQNCFTEYLGLEYLAEGYLGIRAVHTGEIKPYTSKEV